MQENKVSTFGQVEDRFAGWFSSNSLIYRFLHGLMLAGILPEDSEEEKLQKALLSLLALAGFIAGICLGLHDVVFEYPTRGLTTFSYSLVTLLGFIHLKVTKQFKLFRFTQLAFILTMPFIAQITHGGFIISGSAIIWSLGSPICAVLFHGPRQSVRWFGAYAIMIVLAAMVDKNASQIEAVKRLTISPWFFVGHLLGISFILFLLVQFFTYRIKKEQSRSEELLLNILPAAIAKRLKQNQQQLIADKFSEAGILFADIVGFTEISGRLKPEEVVEMLNQVFSKFDGLACKYGLEKIKTIGDAYMVVEGLPNPDAENQGRILMLAIDMMDAVKAFNNDQHAGLSLRIGINNGPVVAGVIGTRKFIYDLWGDAVNVASRMESTGIAGEIQVTEKTFELFNRRFEFVERGLIPVKGKGEMKTFFLKGRKP
ncbi:MAG: adenylate/guanylate cyclase domain-containing protein [Candidatus Rifleibacteriota bacterium]